LQYIVWSKQELKESNSGCIIIIFKNKFYHLGVYYGGMNCSTSGFGFKLTEKVKSNDKKIKGMTRTMVFTFHKVLAISNKIFFADI
jgi:hypothetical protein